MNIFLIAVLIILIGSMIWGYCKGFIRIAFSLVSMILMIVLVSWATPYITDILKEKTSIYEDLADKCSSKIQETAELKIEDELDEEESAGKETLEDVQLPKLWVEQILEKAGDTVSQAVEESGIYRHAGEYMADWVLRGIAFFAAFCLVGIFLKFAVGMLDIVTKLPIIKGVNRLLGGIAGLVQGLLIVWLLMFLVAIACTTELGQTVLAHIEDSEFLTLLYQKNGIMYFFQYMFG